MAIYVSMLRGINVSGQKIIKMEDLRNSFEDLGLKNVKTYVQSGNVVFSCPKISVVSLSKKIEEKILKDFRYSVPVIVRTNEDLKRVIKTHPFSKAKGVDLNGLYVTFLSKIPDHEALKIIKALKSKGENFHIEGAEIYLHYACGYGKAKLTNNVFEKASGAQATTRNWNTINALLEMSAL